MDEIPELSKFYWPGTAPSEGRFFVAAKAEDELLTNAQADKVIRRAEAYEGLVTACKLALREISEKGECYAKAAIEQALGEQK